MSCVARRLSSMWNRVVPLLTYVKFGLILRVIDLYYDACLLGAVKWPTLVDWC